MIDDLINKDVFKTKSHLKKIFFLKKIKNLTLHHYNNCINYKKIIQNIKSILAQKFHLYLITI